MPFPQPIIDVAIYTATGYSPQKLEPEKRMKLTEIFTRFIDQQLNLEEASNLLVIDGYDPRSVVRLMRILNAQSNSRKVNTSINIENNLHKSMCHRARKRSMPWTMDEDELLLAGIYRYRFSDWQKVSSFVGNGRTPAQCGQRWFRCLDPNMKKEKWTKEEDNKLINLVQVYGVHSWTKIAKEFGNRTDVQCRYRYKRISKQNEMFRVYDNQNINSIFPNIPNPKNVIIPQTSQFFSGGFLQETKQSIFQDPQEISFFEQMKILANQK